MKKALEDSLRAYLTELLVYGVLVVAYFFLVLRLLGHWLYQMFETDRGLYAFVALALIICQGVLLETFTRLLLSFLQSSPEE